MSKTTVNKGVTNVTIELDEVEAQQLTALLGSTCGRKLQSVFDTLVSSVGYGGWQYDTNKLEWTHEED